MELITTYICKDFDIGIHNNMFGGKIMSLIDDAAASYASQLCDSPNMVTIKVDELVFKKAVKSGAILKVYGRVEHFGNSSVELYIEVRKHNVYTGLQDIVTHTNVTFVRIDDEGRSIPIDAYVKSRFTERMEIYGKALISEGDRPLKS
jgi:acyl-CoA thioesterase YciA